MLFVSYAFLLFLLRKNNKKQTLSLYLLFWKAGIFSMRSQASHTSCEALVFEKKKRSGSSYAQLRRVLKSKILKSILQGTQKSLILKEAFLYPLFYVVVIFSFGILNLENKLRILFLYFLKNQEDFNTFFCGVLSKTNEGCARLIQKKPRRFEKRSMLFVSLIFLVF